MRKLLVIFLVMVNCVTLFSQTSTTSVVMDNVTNTGASYYFHQRKVARTTNGVLMVVWNDKAAAGGQAVYSIYDPAFGQWLPPVAISNAQERAIQPAIAADEKGNIHASWQQRTSSSAKYQIYYAKFNGAAWNTPKKVSLDDANPSEEATIEVDTKGNLWIVYNNDGAGDGKEFIFAIKSTDDGGTWSTVADTICKLGSLGSSIEVGRAALTSGPNGKLAAIWDNSITGKASRRETYVNQYDGTKWMGEYRISDTTSADRDANQFSAIAIDNQSNVYAFYFTRIISSSDSRPRFFYMHKKGWNDSWTLPPTKVLTTEKVNPRAVSSVVDENNIIHLVYHRDVVADTSFAIDEVVYTFSKDGGANWSTPIAVNRDKHDGGYVTIANRVRKNYGVDIAFRESASINRNDQDTLSIVYSNIPYSSIVSIKSIKPDAISYDLIENYPNPFNPSTTIQYQLRKSGEIELVVHDALGKEVKTLYKGVSEAGKYSIVWNGLNENNFPVASGTYFARLKTDRGLKSIKIILMK